jgi:hypothetical protein
MEIFHEEILCCVTNYVKHSWSVGSNMSFAELHRELAAHKGNQGSSVNLQELATGPNPDADASSPNFSILFL